jgi:hypothetical protein
LPPGLALPFIGGYVDRGSVLFCGVMDLPWNAVSAIFILTGAVVFVFAIQESLWLWVAVGVVFVVAGIVILRYIVPNRAHMHNK